MEWSEETIVRLRSLWSEGHSTAEIGRRLGVSKNAVVGKAHRLDLPARPSPIRRDGCSARAALPRAVPPARPFRPSPAHAAVPGGGTCGPLPGADATTGPASAAPPSADPAHLRSHDRLLLADRRARDPEFPVLQCGFGAGQTLLRRPCPARLREGPRPPGRRRLARPRLHPSKEWPAPDSIRREREVPARYRCTSAGTQSRREQAPGAVLSREK